MSDTVQPPKCVIKLNQNENPLGTSPSALKAIESHYRDAYRYPDVLHLELKRKLAARHGVTPEEVIISAGSVELMDICIKTYLERDDNLVTAEVTFEGYKYLARANRKECRLVPLKDYRVDLERTAQTCDAQTKLVFIANPNNPTGTTVTHRELSSFLQSVPATTMVVSDEAYSEYITQADFPNTLELRKSHPNLIIFHTFSKVYGLAGLRIGYAVAANEEAARMMPFRTPFSINSLALAAAAAALDDAEFLTMSTESNRRERQWLYLELKRLGFNVIESQGNFLFIDFPDAAQMERMFNCLHSQDVQIRKLASFGAANSLRITIGREDQNRTVVALLRREYS